MTWRLEIVDPEGRSYTLVCSTRSEMVDAIERLRLRLGHPGKLRGEKCRPWTMPQRRRLIEWGATQRSGERKDWFTIAKELQRTAKAVRVYYQRLQRRGALHV